MAAEWNVADPAAWLWAIQDLLPIRAVTTARAIRIRSLADSTAATAGAADTTDGMVSITECEVESTQEN